MKSIELLNVLTLKCLLDSSTLKYVEECSRSVVFGAPLVLPIRISSSRLRTFQNELNFLRSDLQFRLNCMDFAHISTILSSINDNLLKIHGSIQ